MSNAGKGKPNQIPGIRVNRPNGDSSSDAPDDLVWDESNPPKIYPCSQSVEHHPQCPGNDEAQELDSELQVKLLNEAHAWVRAGMSFGGVPAAYQQHIPIAGIKIELVDLLQWLEVIKDVVIEMNDMTEFEFQEKFREKKLAFLQEIRLANEAQVRRQRVADSVGIVQRPPLLGPDGNPLR